ncbi:MAG: prepilin-type N-terminal cleavage/methylation domain-containing protein [bacterium]|nr:prepilin-type N-terminal cleavage/methylation domain-containing protein [bacterium]
MKKFYKKGFTLIELLIVIALLGALAVGLLAALDPFEQLKKGTDTGARNLASEVQGSMIRFYALKSYMPWCNDLNCGGVTDPSGAALSSLNAMITNIVSTGELKTNFSSLAGANLGKVYVTGSSLNAIVRVCYLPTSKAMKCETNTQYDKYGVVNTACPGAVDCGTTNSCYWCVQ